MMCKSIQELDYIHGRQAIISPKNIKIAGLQSRGDKGGKASKRKGQTER